MAGQSIRDIVIKISIENGNMKVGPVDASAIVNAGNASATASDKSAMAAERAADKSAAAAVRSYGNIMRERERAADDVERQSDREAQAAIRSYSKIMAEREKHKTDTKDAHEDVAAKTDAVSQAQDRAQMSAVQMAKGVAFLAASNSENSESMIRMIAAAQGYFDIITGGMAMMKNYQEIQKAGVALTEAQAAADELATSSAAAKGAASSAAASASTGGGASAAGAVAGGSAAGTAAAAAGISLLLPLLAALVVAIAAWRLAVQEARDTNKTYWGEMVQDAERVSARVVAALSLVGEQGRRMASEMPSAFTPVSNFMRNIGRREAIEASNREMETRTDMTPEQKAEHRQRTETEQGQREAFTAAGDERRSLEARKAVLDKTHAELSDPAAAQAIKNAHRNIRSTIEHQQKEIGSRKYSAFDVMGGVRTQDQNQFAKLTVDHKKDQVQEQAELKDLAESRLATEQDLLKVNQAIGQSAFQQLQIAKETQQSAHASVVAEKEKIRQGHVSFGRMSRGDQNLEMRLQAKHLRIKAQRTENEARKAVGLAPIEEEKYTQHELEGPSFGNIAEETMEQQAEEEGKKRGVMKRNANKNTLKDKEQLEGKADKDVEDLSGNLKGVIESSAIESAKGTQAVIAAIKRVFEIQNGDLKRFQRELDELAAKYESNKQLQQKTFR